MSEAAKETERLQTLAHKSRGFATNREAVAEIGKVRKKEATSLLLEIALDENAEPNNRATAIAELSRRQERVSGSLSVLLDREESLGMRLAVTRAFGEIVCDQLCTKRVLRYLENPNQQSFLNSEVLRVASADTINDLERDHERMVAGLTEILRMNKPLTLSVLTAPAWPEKAAPSTFALETALSVGLPEFCPDLTRLQVASTDAKREKAIQELCDGDKN